MAPVLALLAAFAFALGTVLQQRGTLDTEAADGDPRFLLEILHKPVWLLGGLSQAGGWFLQAVALGLGSLVLVQSLCALSLVIALPLGARLTAQHITRSSVLGAGLALVGIVLFVAASDTTGGITTPPASSWWGATVGVVGAAGLLAVAGRSRRGPVAAALLGAGAGVTFAYQAAVTKSFMAGIGDGLTAILASWTTYALILSALLGFALQQSALRTGSLPPAMASSNATTLAISVLLGSTIFEERIAGPGGQVVWAIAGLAVALAGIVVLASAASPDPAARVP